MGYNRYCSLSSLTLLICPPAPHHRDPQPLVPALDLLGAQVEDPLSRPIELIRRSAGKERDRAREHLLGLFAAVGNDDERVLKGRQSLASALF